VITPRRQSILQLISGALLQAVANSATALLSTMLLKPQDRGLMVVAVTIASVCTLIGALGTGAGFRALLPSSVGRRGADLAAAYLWISIAASVLAGLLAALACLVSARIVDPSLATGGLIVAVSMQVIALTIAAQTTEAWFAVGNFRAGAGWVAASAVAGFGAVALGAEINRTPTGLMVWQAVGLAFPTFISLTRLLTKRVLTIRRPRIEAIQTLIALGAPSLGLVVGLNVVLRGDRYLLAVFTGTASVAVYSLAATIAESSRLVPAAMGQIFYREVSLRAGIVSARTPYVQAVFFTSAAGIVVASAGWAAIPAIFGDTFADARFLLFPLLLAEVAFAPFNVACRGLLGGGWTRAAGMLGTVGGILTLIAYAVLVKFFGVWGAASASIFAYGLLSLASVRVLRHKLTSTPILGSRQVPILDVDIAYGVAGK